METLVGILQKHPSIISELERPSASSQPDVKEMVKKLIKCLQNLGKGAVASSDSEAQQYQNANGKLWGLTQQGLKELHKLHSIAPMERKDMAKLFSSMIKAEFWQKKWQGFVTLGSDSDSSFQSQIVHLIWLSVPS